jgi:hypothetical protein
MVRGRDLKLAGLAMALRSASSRPLMFSLSPSGHEEDVDFGAGRRLIIATGQIVNTRTILARASP